MESGTYQSSVSVRFHPHGDLSPAVYPACMEQFTVFRQHPNCAFLQHINLHSYSLNSELSSTPQPGVQVGLFQPFDLLIPNRKQTPARLFYLLPQTQVTDAPSSPWIPSFSSPHLIFLSEPSSKSPSSRKHFLTVLVFQGHLLFESHFVVFK